MDGDRRSPFGTLLRELRLGAGLSQEALAEQARLAAETISGLERGKRKVPYRETVALLAQALKLSPADRERLEAAGRTGPQPRRRGLMRRDNLPLALTSFHGRQSELAELGGMLGAHQLVTLTGPGGVGKTRLSLEAAGACMERFPDGVWFVDLAQLTDGELVGRTVGLTLGVQEVERQPLRDTLVNALHPKQLMLMLDNCEHLVTAVVDLVVTLLESCPQVRFLTTSREPLRIAGEHCYPVAPLALPPAKTALSISAVRAYPALSLFAERAAIADPSFRCTADHVAPIAEICRQLDGMPLAIELAAARVRLLSPTQIVSRLDARFRLLTGGSRTALPRQQTLGAAIDWSYDLLEPEEQAFFRRLGIFAGRFGFEAAQAVCADDDADEFAVLDRLASLIDKSLVVATGVEAGRQRYRLLESMRLYARERLAAGGEEEQVRRQLREHVRAAVRETIAAGDRDEIRWTDRIEADLDNIRAVLDWAIVEGRDIVFGAKLVDELWPYWLDTGKFLEVKRLYDKILERAPELGDALAGKILLTYGLLMSRRWNVDESRRSLERTLVLLRPLDDEHLVARTLNGLAITYQECGDWKRAETLYTESLQIVRRLGNPHAAAIVLMNLGVLTEHYRADYQRAEALYLECLGLAREHDDAAQQAHVLQNLAELSVAREQYDLAIDYAKESLPLWRANRNEEYVAVSQVLIGTAELALGHFEAASVVLFEALPTLVALHRGAALVSLFIGLAELALSDSHVKEAAQIIGFAQRLSEDMHEHATVKARKSSEVLVARAYERMDEAVFDTFIRRGRSLTPQQAGDLAVTTRTER